ncbi:MAG: discoidin domain-containing protein [Planctomycetota bacterium]
MHDPNSNELDPWWQVDLGRPVQLDRVTIFNRTDASPERTRNIQILVALDPDPTEFETVYRHHGETFYGAGENRLLEPARSSRPSLPSTDKTSSSPTLKGKARNPSGPGGPRWHYPAKPASAGLHPDRFGVRISDEDRGSGALGSCAL